MKVTYVLDKTVMVKSDEERRLLDTVGFETYALLQDCVSEIKKNDEIIWSRSLSKVRI